MKLDMTFEESNQAFEMNVSGAVIVNGGGGEDGFSPIVEVEEIEGGNRVTITDKDGEKAFDVMDGRDGQDGKDGKDGKDGGCYIPEVFQLADDAMLVSFFPENISGEHTGKDYTITLPHGADGYTPKKGVDYWTSTDKQEIIDDVIEQTSGTVIGSIGEKSLIGNATDLNTASGRWSVALNYNSTASGDNSVATGTTTTASGAAALSANCGTEATGDISTAFGNYTKATTTYAFASGDHTEANGVASFAANHNNKANGQNSFASGSSNTVTGKNGFAAGVSNTVSGETSSAFGLLNEVSGKYSHAFGQQNSVTHNYSSANGYNQKNGGHFSHTFNHSTETVADNQSAFGKFNKASYDSLFMIGVGTSDTARKNAFEVKSNGTVMIGNAPLTEEKVNSIGNSSGITDAVKQEIIDEVLEQIPDAPEQLVKAGTGTNSTISNDHSHNIASGNYSNATGFATMANGDKAHAEGDNTKAAGTASHAEGYGVHALSAYQHAQGKWNVFDAAGKYAHIIGNGSSSSRSNAHTVDWNGLGWFKGGLKVGGTGQTDSNAVDVLTTKDKQSIINEVLGQIPEPSGDAVVVAGTGTNSTIGNDLVNNVASGQHSHAEGMNTTAGGSCAHAEGLRSTASGHQSHSEGADTTASGLASHAEGQNTVAQGDRSHAEGMNTSAIGNCAHAEGSNTIARKEQHVQGKFNIEDTELKYAHIVGNGGDYDSSWQRIRSNAHTLDWGGVGWFAGGLKVGGTGQDDENAVDILAYVQALEERIKALEG